ncbi:hypothetical protein [Prochlorococcus sp. MIT 1307]|uniref:hypothetical protein n=1 Tax=Prochlorococcus sp. MIT 1307 TaxID=3096219 RepID=UPI002A758333|nr:hypothetical protein [Prochlorococcus sp. MIT 1307]
MKLRKQILLILCTIPLISIVTISAFNLNKNVRIKILTWTSPTISLGIVMTLASSSSALISLAAALTSNSKPLSLKRAVKYSPSSHNINNKNQPLENDFIQFEEEFSPRDDLDYQPERDIRDPIPTISVPFKILNKRTYKEEYKNSYSTHNEFDIDETIEEEEAFEEIGLNKNQYNDEWGIGLEEDW